MDANKKLGDMLSISDFAELSRTTRKTLLHYDKIGLLSPLMRGGNKYRYYAIAQLDSINLIHTLQKLGLSLGEIKNLKDHRTPENTSEMLERQIVVIDEIIERWVRSRTLLYTIKQNIDAALSIDERTIEIKHMPAKSIVQGELNDYSGKRTDYDALRSFYANIKAKYPNIDIAYPVWATFSEQRVRQHDWKWPDRFYLSNPNGYDRKPAALYAIGYSRGGYGENSELYERMLEYIAKNGYEICGDAYEEYPLNEVCVSDRKNYLVCVMITVRKKSRTKNISIDRK